jgi:methyl-accepting chemotaxis protein
LEIQTTTREVVVALSSVAEAIDQLSDVTMSVSAAIEQQRHAAESFAASARESGAAVFELAAELPAFPTWCSAQRGAGRFDRGRGDAVDITGSS